MKRTCQDIMTKDPVCCEPTDSAQRTARLMKERNVGAIPICESHGTKLLGIVTDRDLAVRVVAEGREPRSTTVDTVMTRRVFSCRPEDDLDKALKLMEQHQVRRVPVMDQQSRIVGIITQGDIAIRLKDPQTIAEVVTEVSKPSVGA